MSGGPTHGRQDQAADPSLAARTTFQEDLTTAGQRRVNLIWEYTQAVIAIQIVFANMAAGAYQAYAAARGVEFEYPFILSGALFLVIGFYFSRTNHAAIGGIGPKAQAPYEGR